MSWQLFILISICVTALTSILQRVMLKKDTSDPIAYSVFFQFCISILILIYGFAIKDINFKNVSSNILSLAIMSFLYGVGNIAVFSALKHTEASKFTILFSSRALFSVLGFTLFLHDKFGPWQLAGTLLIISAILVVNYGEFSWKLKKGDLYALLAGVCFGLVNIFDKILLGNLPLNTYLFLAFFLPTILILVLIPKTFGKLKTVLNTETLKVMLSTVVLYTIGAITFFGALKVADSPSKVTTVNLSGVILTVILAILLLKERSKISQKILGAVLCVIGLYFIV